MASVCVHQSRYHPDSTFPAAQLGEVAQGVGGGLECMAPDCPFDHIIVEWWTGMNRDLRTKARIIAAQDDANPQASVD